MTTRRIVQLTDTHLYGEPERFWASFQPALSLDAVLADIDAREAPIDALLLTGDIAMDGETEAYRAIAARCAERDVPVLAVPGNHDDPDAMAAVFGPAGIAGTGVHALGAWDLVLLSSHVPGEPGGAVSDAALAALEAHLAASRERPQLIAVHHPPVAVGSAWIDAMGLENGGALLTLLQRYPRVRAVVSGHVHQVFEARREHIDILTSPSTCMQFKPGSEAFAEDGGAAPGYRWLELADDGTLASGVTRVAAALPAVADSR